MSPRRRRWWLVGTGLALLVLGALGWAFLSSGWGLRAAWRFAEGRLPAGVTVDSLSGRLRSPLTLHGVAVGAAAGSVSASRITLDWSLWPLMRRSLPVRRLEVDSVVVELASGGGPREGNPSPLPAVSAPIAASVRSALVRSVTILPSPGARAVQLDTVHLGAVSFTDRLAVEDLRVVGPDVRAEARGWLALRDDYPFSVEVEAAATGLVAELPPMEGRVALEGDLSRLTVTAQVRRPLEAELTATVSSPRGGATFAAELVLSELDPRELRGTWPQLRVRGSVSASGHRDSIRASTTGRIDVPSLGATDVDGVIHRMGDTLLIEKLDATAREMRIRSRGTVVLAEAGPEGDLTLNGAALRWPMDAPPSVRVDTAWVRARGTASAYRLVGGLRGASRGGPTADVRLTGAGSRDGLDLSELRLDAPEGSVRAQGTLGWAQRPTWDLAATLSDLDLSSLLPDTTVWSGRLSLRGRTRGELGEDGPRGTVTVEELDGRVRGEVVRGTAAGAFRLPSGPGHGARRLPHLSFDSLALGWGPNTLEAKGLLADSLDLDLRLVAADLASVLPNTGGYLEVEGTLTGSPRAPAVEGVVSGRGLSRDGRAVDELLLTLHVDSEWGGPVEVRGVAAGIVFGGTRLDSLGLSVTGSPEEHRVQGRLTGSRGALDLTAFGGVADLTALGGMADLTAIGGMGDRTWRGYVHRLDFALDPLGSWSLADSVHVSLSGTHADVDRACWRSAGSTACTSGTWSPGGGTTLDASLLHLGLDRLEPSMPEGWSASGVLNADLAMSVSADRVLTLDGRADFGSGWITYPVAGESRTLAYSDARLELSTDEAGSRAIGAILLSGQETATLAAVTGDVTLPGLTSLGPPLPEQAVAGRLQASVTDLSVLEAVQPLAQNPTGELHVDLSVTGTVGVPELAGEARLSDGSMDVPNLGLELRDVGLTARGIGREGLAVEGQARSGSGTVRIEGVVPPLASASDTATLRIWGTRVQVLDVPEASVWASPALDLTLSRGRIDLTGTVDIPRARVELAEASPTAVAPSRDVVFVDDPAPTPASGRMPDIRTSVRINLGDSVSFRGFGLTAQPTGGVLATDDPGRATTATGEIGLTGGRYRAYGQELTIERGRLVYAGGLLDNPGLDVRATRRASDGVVAGLDIRGTARNPEATLFSEPAMTQSEALAYVILGGPLAGATGSQGDRVAEAAASLGIRGGNALAGRIAQRLGLAEVRIDAENPLQPASLVAGTYLSPRLYVSYGVGLFEPVNTFRMRYTLSRLWTLQAETGKAPGADLMYRIQRVR